jgi:hypothetical protein
MFSVLLVLKSKVFRLPPPLSLIPSSSSRLIPHKESIAPHTLDVLMFCSSIKFCAKAWKSAGFMVDNCPIVRITSFPMHDDFAIISAMYLSSEGGATRKVT